MKENDNTIRENHPLKNNLCLVPDYFLETLINRQDKILQMLEGKINDNLSGFITEKQAMDILKKKSTWFWQMRRDSKLPFKRIGRTIYYSQADISSLLHTTPQ